MFMCGARAVVARSYLHRVVQAVAPELATGQGPACASTWLMRIAGGCSRQISFLLRTVSNDHTRASAIGGGVFGLWAGTVDWGWRGGRLAPNQ